MKTKLEQALNQIKKNQCFESEKISLYFQCISMVKTIKKTQRIQKVTKFKSQNTLP